VCWLQAFLDESEVRGSAAEVRAAALAVAGAVENNRCPMTNISWVIDGKQLQQQFKFRVAVLNDFEAVGYGIPAMAGSDLVALNDVPVAAEAPKVVMGEWLPQQQSQVSIVCPHQPVQCVPSLGQQRPAGRVLHLRSQLLRISPEPRVWLLLMSADIDVESCKQKYSSAQPLPLLLLLLLLCWFVAGPGTGLGAAQLFWDSGIAGYKVRPSQEGMCPTQPDACNSVFSDLRSAMCSRVGGMMQHLHQHCFRAGAGCCCADGAAPRCFPVFCSSYNSALLVWQYRSKTHPVAHEHQLSVSILFCPAFTSITNCCR
jgi:hypothetical protein